MRFWSILASVWLFSLAVASALPTAMSFTTDSPGGNEFVRNNYVVSDKYKGVITLTLTDTTNNWVTISSNATNSGNSSYFYLLTYTDRSVVNPLLASQTGSAQTQKRLKWGTEIVSVTATGNQYTFVINVNGKGDAGGIMVVAYDPNNATESLRVISTNKAWIDANAPASASVVSPVPSSNQINYVGRNSAYNMTASANYQSNNSYYQWGTPTSGNTDTYRVEFYMTSVSDATWGSNAYLVAAQNISSSTASATASFASSNVRLPYVGIMSYDAAGNPTIGVTLASGNLLDTKWLALGKFKDDHNNAWCGDDTFAGNWQSSANIAAGANVSLQFYAVNAYGDRNTTYSATGNVELASATANVPQNGFNGSVPDLLIGSGNVTTFIAAGGNGIVTYGGCVNLYRQETVQLGCVHDGGALWMANSSPISVMHNRVNDVIFVSSGNTGSYTTASDNLHSSGNGVTGVLSNFENAVAGTDYKLRVAIVDRYLNLCKTNDFGGSDNVTLGSNANDPMTLASNINGYRTFGASSNLTYTMAYPSAYTWNTNGKAGLIDITNKFYVEESGNIQLTNTTVAGVSADNVQNNTVRITVNKASSKVVYFDDSNNYRFSGNLEGNFFAAGNAMTVYAHITDLYGNHYTTDSTSSVNITAYTSVGNTLVSRAYRNDSTTYYGYQSNVITASNGKVTIPLRFDHATTSGSGNATYYPYTSLALKAVLSGASYSSESLGVLPQPKSHVYFANAAGEPISSANTLGTTNYLTSGNAIVGTEIRVAGAIGDNYGNIDLTATDNIGLVYTSLGQSPSGNSAFSTAGNTRLAVTGVVIGSNALGATPVKKDTSKSLSLQVTGLTSETSSLFNIDAGAVTQLDFVASTGVYGSDNIIANNTAGNTFRVYAAGLDAYFNTNGAYAGSGISLATSSANRIDTSPAGNAATFTQLSSGNGIATFSVNIFDAEVGVRLNARNSGNTLTKDSSPFTISANTSNGFVLRFVTAGNLTNDNLTSDANHILGSSNTMTSGYAGNAMTFYAAELDHYGNLSARTGANITLASYSGNTPSSNITYSSLKTTGGNTVTFAGQTTTSGIATFNQVFYVAEANRMVKIQDTVQVSGGNTSNFSPVFTVLPNRPSLSLFTDSTGIWPGSTGSSLTFASGNVAPASNVLGLNVGINNLYVGFYDNFGNRTATNVTGSVNIGVYSDNDSGDFYSAAANIGLSSGNLNASSNVVYFDPDNGAKKVSIAAAGNYLLKIGTSALSPAITGAGNFGRLAVQDITPPSIKIVTPNGGERFYTGTWPAAFTIADTVISGNYVPYISYNSGVTWTTSGAPVSGNLLNATTQTISWTIASNVSSETVRLKIVVTDGTGNVVEDISDADFSISPSTSVISYVVGDTSSNTVIVHFREGVYSPTGVALSGNSFVASGNYVTLASGNVALASGSNVSHTAGSANATLTLSANLVAADFNSAPAIGLRSGNVSKNSSGASAYTAANEIASSNIRQLVVTPSANIRTRMSSGDNQIVFGLKLTGWTNNTELKQVNIKIDSVGGIITASDFASGSNTSKYSGVALLDSGDNVITLTSAPIIVIGDTISLNCSNTLSTNALTGTGNFNFKVSVNTSSTISDVVPDSFKVSVQSVTIADTTTGTNVYKVYIPYGTLTTNPIIADITAPAAPVLSIASYVNSTTVSSANLTLQFEANAHAYHYYTDSMGVVLQGNTVTESGNGLVTKTVTTNLGGLSDGTVTLRAYAVDSIGNNGNTQGLISTTTFILDTHAISSSNVAVSMSNITNASKNSVNYTMITSGANELGASYSVTFRDSAGNTSTVYTGTLASSANTLALTGLDLSRLAEGQFTANVTLTDKFGNITHAANVLTVTKDTVGPVLGALTVNDSLLNLTEATNLTISSANISESCTVTYTLTDSAGNTIRETTTTSSSNSVTISKNITTLLDGTISITAYGTDANGNQGASVTSSVVLDKTPCAVPMLNSVTGKGMPTFSWSPVSGANTYMLYLSANALSSNLMYYSSNLIYMGAGTSYSMSSNLLAGNCTWSVNVTDLASNIPSSNTASFYVLAPSAPVLTSPISGVAIAAPTLRWESVVDAARYDVEVKNNAIASANVYAASLTGTSVAMSSSNYLASGNYTWRVRTTDIYGNTGNYNSTSGVFEVKKPNAPVLTSPISGVATSKNPTLRWESVSDASKYEVVVYQGGASSGSKVYSANVYSSANITSTSNIISGVDTAGSYTWMVRTTDIYGNPGDYVSGSFEVKKPNAPVLTSPISGVSIARPTLSWESVVDAAKYEVIVDNALSANVYPLLTGTSITMSSNLRAGNYTWRVRTTDVYGLVGDFGSNVGRFEVKNPNAPILTSPISSVATSKNPTLRWESVAEANKYEVVVYYGVVNSSNIVYSGYVSASANVTSTSNIASGVDKAGNYFWVASTTDIYGNKGLESAPGSFVVKQPNAPVLTSPISGIATSATPTLRWEPVIDAANYEVVVLNSSLANVYSANVTGTSNTISPRLAGTYTWKVRTTDIYGFTGEYNASMESFVVKIPVLSYVVGELDSPNAVAVFDQEVFSNTNGTGALTETNFDVTGLKGIALVNHIAGDPKVNLTFGSFLNSANVNMAKLSPKAVYALGGNAAKTDGIEIRQLEVKDKVVSTSALVYGGEAKTVARINAKGWLDKDNTVDASVSVVGIDYTIVPVNGLLDATDFSDDVTYSIESVSGGNLTVSKTTGKPAGTFGSNQTLTIPTPVALVSANATGFDLQLKAASQSSVLHSAKVAKVKVNKVLLNIGGNVVARQLAGTTTTSDLSLTNVSFTTYNSTGSSNIAMSTGSDNLAFTVGQTIKIIVGNVSDRAGFTWTQTSGNLVSLMPSANTLSFIPTEAGQFGFKLTYSLGGYSIDLAMSSNVTINTAQSAGILTRLSSGNLKLETQADYDQGFSALTTLVGGVSGQAENIVSSAANLVLQYAKRDSTLGVNVTNAQVASLIDVVEEAVTSDSIGDVNKVVELLKNVKSLPAVNTAQVQQVYKTLAGAGLNTIGNLSRFVEVNQELANLSLKSLVKTGSKTITTDISNNGKSVVSGVERLYQGQINTLSLGGASELKVTMDKTTLAKLTGSDNVALYAVKLPVYSVTLSGNGVLASPVYEISLTGFDKTKDVFASVPFPELNSSGNLSVVMSLNQPVVASGNEFKVVYRNSELEPWTPFKGAVTQPNSSGLVTFQTPHLTQFAVVEVAPTTAASVSGGGGGGCLLK